MKTQVKEVRGLIYQEYKSMAEFSRMVGWPRQRIDLIVMGKKVPNLEEVEVLAKHLHIPVGDMAQIFLNQKSPNRQQRGCRSGASGLQE